MKNKCPCHGCFDRTVTCHGRCERYQSWKKEREDKLREEIEVRKKDAAPTDRVKHRAWQKMKWK